ncbi:hypothetical protein CEB94_33410 [Streptomyces hawaiiensis]|uniref:Mutator family transposase n=1 Tax=Streptomyces hawaiiensis TaxID=67305 RepID=A0A6G5RNL7_9ACTN|nr:transposase [Streptomyces hawaiiensis]QCD59167.1 hypothetical protein CEB94_33410 [Streptomyces hawaiiensis]
MARVLKPVYTAPTDEAALERSPSSPIPGARSTRRSSGSGRTRGRKFILFLRFDTEIRRIVCTANAIESVNARARGHFPNETAALKCVYMAIMSLDPTGKGQARWTMRWKTALNAFGITFDGRLSTAR